jgi:hypothetical protein
MSIDEPAPCISVSVEATLHEGRVALILIGHPVDVRMERVRDGTREWPSSPSGRSRNGEEHGQID